jgi:hypothetical protein
MPEDLEALVRKLNGWCGRPSEKPLVQIASCKFCGHRFPVQAQDYSFAKKNSGSVCGGLACRREMFKANKARQRWKTLHKTTMTLDEKLKEDCD